MNSAREASRIGSVEVGTTAAVHESEISRLSDMICELHSRLKDSADSAERIADRVFGGENSDGEPQGEGPTPHGSIANLHQRLSWAFDAAARLDRAISRIARL